MHLRDHAAQPPIPPHKLAAWEKASLPQDYPGDSDVVNGKVAYDSL